MGRKTSLAVVIATVVLPWAAAGCGDGSPRTGSLIPASALEALALTEAEGSRVVPGFTVYPHSPPVGIVSNEDFRETASWGNQQLQRALVNEFHRQSGYHGEYFAEGPEDLRFTLEMDLYPGTRDAEKALAAIVKALPAGPPTGQSFEGPHDESIGNEGHRFTATSDFGPRVDVVVFRRANLVVAFAGQAGGAGTLEAVRTLANIIDVKAMTAHGR